MYPSIFLYIDGNYYEVTPSTFVLTLDVGVPNYCLLAIAPNSAEYWLVGDTFLRNYYTIWDNDNNRMGFAPHSLSTATITVGTLPNSAVYKQEEPTNDK